MLPATKVATTIVVSNFIRGTGRSLSTCETIMAEIQSIAPSHATRLIASHTPVITSPSGERRSERVRSALQHGDLIPDVDTGFLRLDY
jgi:hypothetical protein